MHDYLNFETALSNGAVWHVGDRIVGNNLKTAPAGFGECFLCGRGMKPHGSRFCSPRCREAFDRGFPRHDPHHARSVMRLPLGGWKVVAPASGSPPAGASYYGPLLDGLRAARSARSRRQKVASGPESQKPKSVKNTAALSMGCKGSSR